jgi:hypothetical protein
MQDVVCNVLNGEKRYKARVDAEPDTTREGVGRGHGLEESRMVMRAEKTISTVMRTCTSTAVVDVTHDSRTHAFSRNTH